jgi:hypothetical protein
VAWGTFGTGSLSVTAQNVCGWSAPKTLYTMGYPQQPGTISGPASVCANSNQSYSVAAVSGAASYTWTVPTGATVTSGQGTAAANVQFGTAAGNVTVKATNACGNSSLRTLAVAMPCRTEDAETNSLSVYPNPSNGDVHFALGAAGRTLHIYDVAGREVVVRNLQPDQRAIKLEALPPGLLHYKLVSADGEVTFGKLVVVND